MAHRISHSTNSADAPSKNGSYAVPKRGSPATNVPMSAKKCWPKWIFNEALDEFRPDVGYAVGGDRIRSDHHQRKCPGLLPGLIRGNIQQRIKTRQEQEAPAAAIQRPAWRPNALHRGANPRRVECPTSGQKHEAGNRQPAHLAQPERPLRSTLPAIRPRIIVPSVGMKLSVA